MFRLSFRLGLFAGALAVLGASQVLASEGVLEINHQCAVSAGCFPGDDPGYPVTITLLAPARSFRLTGDLGPLGANQTAISISTNAVTIDLAGFRIYGSTQCTVVPVTCAPLGSGVGVQGGSDVTVKDGTVQGMGDDGVQIDYSSHAENLHLLQNGGDGLSLGNLSLARGNVVTSNGGDGIRCGQNCGIHQNTIVGNKFHGIEQTSGTVTGNAASGNGARGGQFGASTLLANNAFVSNVAPDLAGGHGAGGNFCSDHGCSTQGERRYYLSKNTATGSNALTACAAGFHMASLFELLDPSNLRYDTAHGVLKADSGQGPPTLVSGWTRTGGSPDGSNSTGSAGRANCVAWTTSSFGPHGSTVFLEPQWDNLTPTTTSPWWPDTAGCDNDRSVWCVED